MSRSHLTASDMGKLRVGMKALVDFKVADLSHGCDKLSLTTIVEEVSSDFHLLIQMPVYQRMYYPMSVNQLYRIRLMSENSIYSVSARFVEKIARDNLIFAKVMLVGPMNSGQKRESYRLPCSFDVDCMKLNISDEALDVAQDEQTPSAEPTKFTCRTVNISGGGMLLVTNEKIKLSEHIMLTIDIGTSEDIVGRVLRVEKGADVAYANRIAIKFIGLTNEQHCKISKFIIKEQFNKRRQLVDRKPLQTRRTR